MRHEKNGAPTYRPAAELSGVQFEIASDAQFENASPMTLCAEVKVMVGMRAKGNWSDMTAFSSNEESKECLQLTQAIAVQREESEGVSHGEEYTTPERDAGVGKKNPHHKGT
ncbi:hypothetical protein E2C01_005003 [Portunus trituberculatus]|uniref:Uncharacterized protein n=1 Tax=Portunus trituberculatus TaxID=210409 RepID=A0A5B7CT42_PORTR|nr:hypothetical protein [Portunus trituberculatus]